MTESDDHAVRVARRLRAGADENDDAADQASFERYRRQHLPKHASDAGELGAVLADPELLADLDAPAVAEQLPITVIGQPSPGAGATEMAENQALFRASYPRHRLADPPTRRQMLMMDAARLGRQDLAERLSERGSWTMRWATGSGRSAAIRQCLVDPAAVAPVLAVTVAISGDDTLLIAAYGIRGGPGRVVVWDVITGTVAYELLDQRSMAETTALASIAVGDQALAAAGFADGTIRIWDLNSRSLINRIDAHGEDADETERPVLALAASVTRAGPILVSAGQNGTVRAWDPGDGRPRGSFTRQHDGVAHLGPVRAAAIVSGGGTGEMLVTAGDDGMLRTWDLITTRLLDEWRAYQAGVSAVAVNQAWRGQPLVVTGHVDGTSAGWNPLTREQVISPYQVSQASITALALHAGGLLAGGQDGTVIQQDLPPSRHPQAISVQGEGPVNLALVRLDERDYLAIGGQDGAIWILDPSPAPSRSRRRGDPDRIAAVCLGQSQQGHQVVSAGLDGSITLRDHATGDQRRLNPLRMALHRPRLLAVTLTPNGQPVLACVGEDVVVVHGPDVRSVRKLPTAALDVTSVAITIAGDTPLVALAVRGPSPTAEIFAVAHETPQHLATLVGPDPADAISAIAAAAVSAEPAATVACIHRSGNIRVWDVRPSTVPTSLAVDGTGITAAVCAGLGLAEDEVLLAVGTQDCSVELWDIRAGHLRNQLTCAEPVRAVAADATGTIAFGQGRDVIALRSRI